MRYNNCFHEKKEKKRDDDDDDDDVVDSKKNLQLLCELIEKLSKCERVCEMLLFSSDEERGCTREEVLNEISKGLVQENTSVRRRVRFSVDGNHVVLHFEYGWHW